MRLTPAQKRFLEEHNTDGWRSHGARRKSFWFLLKMKDLVKEGTVKHRAGTPYWYNEWGTYLTPAGRAALEAEKETK